MHSLASIFGVVLASKDTYPRWSRKIKSTFIYNYLWNEICEGNTIKTEAEAFITIDPRTPRLEKEFAIWNSIDKK